MFETTPGQERSLSVRSMLVAISALITGIVEADDHSGGVVELLHCTHLVLANADVYAPAGRKHLYEPGGSVCFACLTSARSICGSGGRRLRIVRVRGLSRTSCSNRLQGTTQPMSRVPWPCAYRYEPCGVKVGRRRRLVLRGRPTVGSRSGKPLPPRLQSAAQCVLHIG